MDHHPSSSSPSIVVVLGGDAVAPANVPMVPDEAFVVAADSGADLAHDLGLRVDLLVGDLDSISARALGRLEDRGIQIDRSPTDKDATDLELALDAALARAGPAEQPRGPFAALPHVHEVAVIGGGGGRPDHALATTLALAGRRYAGLRITHHTDGARTHVLHAATTRDIDAAFGATFSVIPVHGPATVSITGARWPLEQATLAPGTTWGISNLVLDPPATVTCHRGTALVVAPHHKETP